MLNGTNHFSWQMFLLLHVNILHLTHNPLVNGLRIHVKFHKRCVNRFERLVLIQWKGNQGAHWNPFIGII